MWPCTWPLKRSVERKSHWERSNWKKKQTNKQKPEVEWQGWKMMLNLVGRPGWGWGWEESRCDQLNIASCSPHDQWMTRMIKGVLGSREGKLRVWVKFWSWKPVGRVKDPLRKAQSSTMAASYPEGHKGSFSDSRSKIMWGAQEGPAPEGASPLLP